MIKPIFHDGKKIMLVIKNLETEQNDLCQSTMFLKKNLVKLNSNQLNIKKITLTKIILEKKHYKKRKHKRNWKKTI